MRAPRLGARYALGEALDLPPSGSTWQARDRLRDRDIVVRVLPAGPWPAALSALQEGQHPSLAAVHETGSLSDGRHFIVSDLPESSLYGEPGEGLDPDCWLTLTAQLLEALEYIHELGWVHGDLRLGSAHRSRTEDRLTLFDPGVVLWGTRPTVPSPCRAPELRDKAPPTVASDLFAAAVLAATSLIGDLPFGTDQRGLGREEHLALPESTHDGLVRWLSGLLRADPNLRPESATAALQGLETACGRDLRRPRVALSRLRSGGPTGREELVGSLSLASATGGLGIVLGDLESGRSTVLRAIHFRLRRSGRSAELIEFGSDPVRSHRALRAVLADHCDFAVEPPRRDLAPAALAAGLRSYEASLLASTTQLLSGGSGPFLFDDVDAGTLSGRVLVAALERCQHPGAIVATDGSSQRVMEGLVAARADARDVPAVLSPLHQDQIARWLQRGLGPVVNPFALAELLASETDGLPGLVLSQLGLLLDQGALYATEEGWSWTEEQVLPVLGGVTQPTLRTGPAWGTPQERINHALEAAERAAAAADPRAALNLLKRELGRLGLQEEPSSLLAPVWDRLAHLAIVVEQPADAAHWLGKLREEAEEPSPTRRARLLVEECRALRASARWPKALSLLATSWDQILEHGDQATQLQGWATLAACHLKGGDLATAEAAVSELEAQTDVLERSWLTRTAALRASLELQAGRPQAAADACARALDRLGDAEGFLRATLSSTLATAMRALGRTDDAIRSFTVARDLLMAEGRHLEASRAANRLGATLFVSADWDGAERAWESFLHLAREADDPWEQCCALTNLGGLFRDKGHLHRAAESLEAALRLARRHRLGRLEPLAMASLAETWARMGDTALAVDAMQEAIDLAERQGHLRAAGESTRLLAVLRLDQGDAQSAQRLIEQARITAKHLDDQEGAYQLDALRGLLGILGQGSQEGDESRALEAIRALSERGATVPAARLRVRLAEALIETTRYGPAEALLDEAEQVLRPLNARPDLSRLEETRRHLARATRSSLQTLTRHHDWLQELTLALARERELEPLVELVLDRALELVGEERGLVRLFDEQGVASFQVSRRLAESDTGTLRVVPEEEQAADPQRTAITSAVIARVLRTRGPVVVSDALTDPELAPFASEQRPKIRGVVCVPILRAEELLGVIYVAGPSVMGSGPDVRAQLLMACADAASVAVENARLIEALKRKQDALAIMAHELRTPVTSIIGFASLLLSNDDERTPQEDGEMIGLIKSEAERVRGMVGRVLELAQMQAADAEWKREPVDVLALVVAGVDSLRPQARQSEVRLDAFADEDLPDLLGDEERLIQVMVNLIGNALKFVPFGGRIEVRARTKDNGALITVADDGPGIAAERIGRIFDPWQQAGSPRMRRKGVGLGLAICQAIVQRHGGWITAENREQGGARFTVWLPAAP